MRRLEQVDASYLAAFIDGEGSFIRAKGTRRWKITVSQTQRDVLDWARMTVGAGTITSERNTGKWLIKTVGSKYEDIHRWHVHGWEAAALVRQLLPYIRVRREAAARLLLDYPEPKELSLGEDAKPNRRVA